MEINPNHPTTRALHDKWHVLCAVLIRKMGKRNIRITLQDLVELNMSGDAIVADGHEDDIELRLISQFEAMRLARKEGGLPV
ncbi:MAG TPA: hypothetical protein VKB47_08650 [Terracidiphilus sp.]|nr:hypothetical protein [Terracidiphilus sp.]